MMLLGGFSFFSLRPPASIPLPLQQIRFSFFSLRLYGTIWCDTTNSVVLVSFRCDLSRIGGASRVRPVLVSFRCDVSIYLSHLPVIGVLVSFRCDEDFIEHWATFEDVLVSFRCDIFTLVPREEATKGFSFFSLRLFMALTLLGYFDLF